MKNYTQFKEAGHILPHEIYRKCINDIKCYSYLLKIVSGELHSSTDEFDPEKIAIDRANAEKMIEDIETALYALPKYYREPVFKKIVFDENYEEVAYEYGMNIGTLKKYVQKYIYFYAKNTGLDFLKK